MQFLLEFRASESLKLAVLQPRKLSVFAITGIFFFFLLYCIE